MELKEMIKVMQHFEDGGEVECADTDFDVWGTVSNPLWNWLDYKYRIKEERQKVTIEKWLLKNVDSGEHFIIGTSDIELNLKDFPELKKVKLIESSEYEVEL